MKKMSVEDAATFFGVSKEAIHNRIRRGSIQSVVENGVKLVVVDEKAKTPQKRSIIKPVNNDRYYKYLEAQNEKLQQRVATLEGETRTLRDQKEQMLIEEKEKLENIYKEKDEQLKNILQTLSSKLMLNVPVEEPEMIAQEDTFEAEIEENEPETELVSLKKHLKTSKLSEKKMKKVLKKFKSLDDERIVRVGKKIYIDPIKYDYKDLIKK